MFGLGSVIDKVADAVGLPEVVGDVAKIGIGIVTKNPALIMDGVGDITPNLCAFVEDTLDLAPGPGEADEDWKKAARLLLGSVNDSAETFRQLQSTLGGGSKLSLPTLTA